MIEKASLIAHLSLQQIFDFAVEGIRSQNYRTSIDVKHGGCMYNHPDGVAHCAIGWVAIKAGVSADLLDEFEGKPVDEILIFDHEKYSELSLLQRVHDRMAERNKSGDANLFEYEFEQYAKTYSLIYTKPKEQQK